MNNNKTIEQMRKSFTCGDCNKVISGHIRLCNACSGELHRSCVRYVGRSEFCDYCYGKYQMRELKTPKAGPVAADDVEALSGALTVLVGELVYPIQDKEALCPLPRYDIPTLFTYSTGQPTGPNMCMITEEKPPQSGPVAASQAFHRTCHLWNSDSTLHKGLTLHKDLTPEPYKHDWKTIPDMKPPEKEVDEQKECDSDEPICEGYEGCGDDCNCCQ